MTGTTQLFRLYLRLDRLRILIWTGSFVLVFWGSIVALQDAFPDAQSLQARARFTDNPATRLIVGPGFGLEDYTFGAMVANELSMLALIAVAVMGITLTVRHTRAEEESGRMETVRSLPVGRHAPTVAAFLVVAVALAAVGTGVIATLIGTGLEVSGSLAFGASITVTGVVFAGVALAAAQITEHARTATGLSLAVLGSAFLLRGLGDAANSEGGLLSWLSPLGWAQQTRVYVDLRWWPLALSLLLGAVALAISVALGRRRDLGAGLRRPPPGPDRAAATLLSPVGLANRLLRGSALAWITGILAFGVTMGSVVNALTDLYADIPDFEGLVVIDPARLQDSFGSAILITLVAGPVAQVVGSVLRWREEEESGRISSVLVTGTSRTRMLLSWLVVAAGYGAASVAALGVGLGTGMAMALSDVRWVLTITGAALVYLPAVLLVAAIAAVLIGLAPRSTGLAWIPVLWVVFIGWLGELLGIPSWLRDLSPVEISPSLPLDPLTWPVPLGLAAAVVALTVVAVAGLRRRDLLA